MTQSNHRLIMQFSLPGKLPGASRKIKWFFGLAHMMCVLSLLYPYLGPFVMLAPLAVLLYVLRRYIPAEAQMNYRFLIQRLLLLVAMTLLATAVLLLFKIPLWNAFYLTLLPLCIADTVQVFRGGLGLFYVRGKK